MFKLRFLLSWSVSRSRTCSPARQSSPGGPTPEKEHAETLLALEVIEGVQEGTGNTIKTPRARKTQDDLMHGVLVAQGVTMLRRDALHPPLCIAPPCIAQPPPRVALHLVLLST